MTVRDYMEAVKKAQSLPKPYRHGTDVRARRIWNQLSESQRQTASKFWACETR